MWINEGVQYPRKLSRIERRSEKGEVHLRFHRKRMDLATDGSNTHNLTVVVDSVCLIQYPTRIRREKIIEVKANVTAKRPVNGTLPPRTAHFDPKPINSEDNVATRENGRLAGTIVPTQGVNIIEYVLTPVTPNSKS